MSDDKNDYSSWKTFDELHPDIEKEQKQTVETDYYIYLGNDLKRSLDGIPEEARSLISNQSVISVSINIYRKFKKAPYLICGEHKDFELESQKTNINKITITDHHPNFDCILKLSNFFPNVTDFSILSYTDATNYYILEELLISSCLNFKKLEVLDVKDLNEENAISKSFNKKIKTQLQNEFQKGHFSNLKECDLFTKAEASDTFPFYKKQRLLLGLEDKSPKNESSLKEFANNSIFDFNLAFLIFEFAGIGSHKIRKPKIEKEEKNKISPIIENTSPGSVDRLFDLVEIGWNGVGFN